MMPHPHPSAASAKSSPMDHGGFQGTRYPKSSSRQGWPWLSIEPKVFWGSYILRNHVWDISESCRIQRSILLLLTIYYDILLSWLFEQLATENNVEGVIFVQPDPVYIIYYIIIIYIYIDRILGLMKGKILRKIPYFIIFRGKIHGFRFRFSEMNHSCAGMVNEVRDTRSRRVTWRIRFPRWRPGQARGPWGPRPGGHLQQPPWLVTFPWWLPTMWAPPVISWFIIPIKYSYKYHKP
jgi:hypothetical protein